MKLVMLNLAVFLALFVENSARLICGFQKKIDPYNYPFIIYSCKQDGGLYGSYNGYGSYYGGYGNYGYHPSYSS
jgi:hypothetical protein